LKGLIEDVVTVGMVWKSDEQDGEIAIPTRTTKAQVQTDYSIVLTIESEWLSQVCHNLGAIALVDDAREHAVSASGASPPVHVLLFGTAEWTKRHSVVRGTRSTDISSSQIQKGESAGVDPTQMSWDERRRFEGERKFWEDDERDSVIPVHAPVEYVSDWQEVVRWAERWNSSKSA
jgi:hypothetical protein